MDKENIEFLHHLNKELLDIATDIKHKIRDLESLKKEGES